MTNYTFELDTRTTRKDGTSALRVKLYRSRLDYVFVGLKIYLRPEQWHSKREFVTNRAIAQIDNARLNAYRMIIGRLPLEIDESGETSPLPEVSKRLKILLAKSNKNTSRCNLILKNTSVECKREKRDRVLCPHSKRYVNTTRQIDRLQMSRMSLGKHAGQPHEYGSIAEWINILLTTSSLNLSGMATSSPPTVGCFSAKEVAAASSCTIN